MNQLDQLLFAKTEHELLQEKRGFVADYLRVTLLNFLNNSSFKTKIFS